MAGEFEEFLSFIYEVTGQYPTTISKYFEDVFIYVPKNKTPPQGCPAGTCSGSVETLASCLLQNFFSAKNEELFQLLYNEGWELLVYHLGTELLRFCLEDCIFAKRTKTGAYMVSCLKELCEKMPSLSRERLHDLFYVTSSCTTEHKSKAQKSVTPTSGNFPKTPNDLEHLFDAKHLEICTDNMLFKISMNSKFPATHILANKNSEVPISSQIIETKVEKILHVGCEKCVTALEPLLKKLRKQNMEYNHENALSELMDLKMDHNDKKGKGQPATFQELPLPLLKDYFTNVCHRILPPTLLGSHKNRNLLVKSICDLLETPKQQSISLMTYILKLNISDLLWLDNIKDSATRWIMAGKLFKWLYNQLILEIFRTRLYVIVTSSTQKVYLKRSDWLKSKNAFVAEMRKQNVIARCNGNHTRDSRKGRWILFPKKQGIRPIISSAKECKPCTAQALCFLQQLYGTKYGQTGREVFPKKWKDLVDERNNNKTMYLVRCDIESAYGSIDQKKLIAIVEALVDSIKSPLFFTHYEIAKNLYKVKHSDTKVKQYFSYPELELPLLPGSVFAPCPQDIPAISKKTLLEEIRSNVLKQVILISNEQYILQKGIAQGATLSSVLCDIYYAHMEDTELAQFKDEGFLYRYVDDILYATEDKASAERFLEIVKQGISNYNCSFNLEKTMTNLPGHRHVYQSISFLGYDINPRTLEVTQNYSTSARYGTLLSKISGKTSLDVFQKRLTNLASLKLDALIINPKINSSETIMRNITLAFERQAQRCLWLVRALIDDIPSQRMYIFSRIRSTNIQIIRRVQRYFRANGCDFEAFAPELLLVPWKSYRNVFGKAQPIHAHFRSLFLGCIKTIERATLKP